MKRLTPKELPTLIHDTVYIVRDNVSLRGKTYTLGFGGTYTNKIQKDISYSYISTRSSKRESRKAEKVRTEFIYKYLGIKLRMGEQVKVDCKDLARGIIKKA